MGTDLPRSGTPSGATSRRSRVCIVISETASMMSWTRAATCMPAGSLGLPSPGCQPSSDDEGRSATDDVGPSPIAASDDEAAGGSHLGRRRSRDDLEAGPLEHRQGAVVDVGRRDPLARRDVDRVGLEPVGAVVAGVVDRGIEERVRDALAARPAPDDEAHDRPDRRVVDRGQGLGEGQALVVAARPDADPADGRVAVVGDETRRPALRAAVLRGSGQDARDSPRPSSSSSPGREPGSRCTSTTSGRRPARTARRGRAGARASGAGWRGPSRPW